MNNLIEKYIYLYIQGDQEVSVHLIITIQSSGAQRLFDHSVYIYIYIYIYILFWKIGTRVCTDTKRLSQKTHIFRITDELTVMTTHSTNSILQRSGAF
jgi:hypothetical protein